jgi:hypothetical protein
LPNQPATAGWNCSRDISSSKSRRTTAVIPIVESGPRVNCRRWESPLSRIFCGDSSSSRRNDEGTLLLGRNLVRHIDCRE